MRPGMRRKRELLPAPFGQVKISAPPAASEKPIPLNARRPPRMQAKSWPDSFIATISLTLASAAPILPSPWERGRLARFEETAGGTPALRGGEGCGQTLFSPRRPVQDYRSYGRTAKESV